MSEEIVWKPLYNWPGYRVSNTGIVQTCKLRRGGLTDVWRDMDCSIVKGHYRIQLSCNNQRQQRYVHELVLINFVGFAPPGMLCRHLDGNGLNNNLSNLKWGTSQENSNDRVKHGNSPTGTKSNIATLSDGKVVAMRTLYRTGNETFASLGRQFGVSDCTARRACLGETWSHLQGK